MRAPSVMLLGIASGLSVFGMSIIVPSMGAIGSYYSADYATVQFVISAYLFGLAIAQPVSGYLSDRFGRRPIMLYGFAIFILASLLCFVAPNLSLLIFSRFLQAVGASVGTVASRAILRDTLDGEKMAEAMSYISAMMGIAPVVAPIIGGILNSTAGFRSSFIVTAMIGIIVFFAMLRKLSETLPAENAQPAWHDLLSNYRTLLSAPRFIGNTLVFGFIQGAFFSFLAIGAPYFSKAYGMDARAFGIYWGSLAIAYISGAAIGAKITPRIGSENLLRLSVSCTFVVGLFFLMLAILESPSLLSLMLLMGFLMFFAGSGTPAAMAGAIRDFPTMAGTAAGLSSAIGLVLGGSFTIIAGTLYDGTFRPIGILIFTATCALVTSWFGASRQPRKPVAEHS